MARYIDADKLLVRIKGRHTVRYFTPTKEDLQLIDIFEIINTQPTADVVEVRHGHWITESKNGSEEVCRCSVCNKAISFFGFYKAKYCDCGAKMDGGKGE